MKFFVKKLVFRIEQPLKKIESRLRRHELPLVTSTLNNRKNYNIRKSNASTEMNTQRTSRERPIGAKKDSSLQWPIKNVKHLAYQRKNRLGRVYFNL